MAITKIGPPLAGVRGTIGGITFSANASGTYAKIWSRGSNPRTQKQTIVRSQLGLKSDAWRQLTAGQKANWDTFAALPAQDLTNSLGDTYSASGFNWFTLCNVRLDRMGLANITATPIIPRPAAPTINVFRVTPPGANPNLCVGGVPSASTQAPGQPPANAFDSNTATWWSTLVPNTTGWLEYQLPAPQSIRNYRIYGPPAQSTTSPKDWTFEYWDGLAWQIVDTRTNQWLTSPGWNTFQFNNNVAAARWRINVSANNGSPTNLTIFELQYFDDALGASAISYPRLTYYPIAPPNFDLVLFVSLHNTTGAQVQYPGFYETLALSVPRIRDEPIQSELTSVFGTIQEQRAWFARLYRQTTEGLRSSPATARTETL